MRERERGGSLTDEANLFLFYDLQVFLRVHCFKSSGSTTVSEVLTDNLHHDFFFFSQHRTSPSLSLFQSPGFLIFFSVLSAAQRSSHSNSVVGFLCEHTVPNSSTLTVVKLQMCGCEWCL